MRRATIALLFALTALLGGAPAGADEASTALGPTADALRQAVAAARPAAARVVFVQGEEVYLDAGGDSGLRVGTALVLERPGGEIRRPETGEVIGTALSTVGRAEVTWADRGFARARVLETAAMAPALHDEARPAAPTRVALVRIGSPGGPTRLGARLDDAVAAALAGLEGVVVEATGGGAAIGPADAAAAAAAGRAAGADLAVAGRVDTDAFSLVLVEAGTGRLLRAFEGDVPEGLRPLAAEAAAPPAAMAPAVPTAVEPPMRRGGFEAVETTGGGGEIEIPFPFEGPPDLAVGDIDGDGRDEIVVTDEHDIYVYRIEGESLVEVTRIDGGFAATFVFLGAADLDGDGKAEILATEKPGNFVRSMVYRWDGNRFTRLWRESGTILRSLRVRGETRVYGQTLGYYKPLEGPVVRLRWNGRGFDEEASGLSSKVTLFDFAPIEPLGLVASLDFEDRIRLYDAGGAVVWKSTGDYGGSDIRLEARSPNVSEEVRRGLLPFDVDGDGLDEVLAVQHDRKGAVGDWLRVGRRSRFSAGRVVVLARERTGLVERSRTRDFAGGLRGLSVGNVRGRGPEAVFLSVAGGEILGLGRRETTLVVVPLR